MASTSLCQSEQLRQFLLVQMGTDHAETACVIGLSMANLKLLRHHIKMQPGSVRARNNALCTQDDAAVVIVRKLCQNLTQLFLAVFVRSLLTPACEDLVCMMVMMVMVMIVAAAVIPMVMVVVMIVVMVVMVVVIIVVMVVMMIVIIVVMVMIVVVIIMVMIVVVMMLMVVAAAVTILAVLMVMIVMMSMLFQFFLHDQVLVLHSRQNLLALQLVPRRRDDRCFRVLLP